MNLNPRPIEFVPLVIELAILVALAFYLVRRWRRRHSR